MHYDIPQEAWKSHSQVVNNSIIIIKENEIDTTLKNLPCTCVALTNMEWVV